MSRLYRVTKKNTAVNTKYYILRFNIFNVCHLVLHLHYISLGNIILLTTLYSFFDSFSVFIYFSDKDDISKTARL